LYYTHGSATHPDRDERQWKVQANTPASAVHGLSCAALVDAMGRSYRHRAHISNLVSPTPTRWLFGRAATIMFLPHRDDLTGPDALGFAGWFYRAVGETPQDKVLVMSHGGHPDASHGGGTKLSRLENHGLAGVLTDARLRDFDQLGGYRFATWCGGEATRWGGDVVAPVAAGIPIQVGGVQVTPGDYVFVDRAGAVIIPADGVEEVISEARSAEAADDEALEKIRGEDPAALSRGSGQEIDV
jgi:regulator of RNase E activity RraA